MLEAGLVTSTTTLGLLVLCGALHGAQPKKSAPDRTALPPPAAGPVDFATDIQPIFAQHCLGCHGPEKQKAGLRLDVAADGLRGGDSGPVIVAGRSVDSVLIHNVAGLDPDYVMPPEGEGERLTKEQIAKLRAWIDAGAVWPQDTSAAAGARPSTHWAFRKPVAVPPPATREASWPRNAVDAFVLARLEAEKIRPAPEADRVTLARRLSFDLLGLPPAPEEVRAFVDDARPDAYERLVDRLLASPHFGERWARHWLDLARYADSDGYEKDNERPYAYLFRDWVIDAINRDLPFDQFTIEQLAGDLLPHATLPQKIATAFHRQTLTNRENGVDQEEFRTKAVVDRVSTTGAVWLGLTVGCAECHTHKFDPITQREFYQLYAFFNNASEKDIPAPQPAESAAYAQQLAAWQTKLAEIEAPLIAHGENPLQHAARETWEKSLSLPATRWSVLAPRKVLAATETTEAELKPEPDHSIVPAARARAPMRFTIEARDPLRGVTGFRLEALPDVGRAVGRGAKGEFTLSEISVSLRNGRGELRPVPLAAARADSAAEGRDAAKAIDGEAETGWTISAGTNRPHVIVFETKEPLDVPEGATLVFLLEQLSQGVMNRFRISATTAPGPLEPGVIPDRVVAALRTPVAQRTPAQAAEVHRYFVEQIDPDGQALAEKVALHQQARPKAPETAAAILVADARKTHIHVRGDFLRRGEEVQPAALGVLHALEARGPQPDRLDLAHWIVAPENPLTARVAVNQVWKNLFGRGLVATTDDFGTRGEKPSHPELLDWLALRFSSPDGLGWSRKALVKFIVMSATYRQASTLRPELAERDPYNVLLARQNRLRLDAESIRDAFLAASGQLVRTVGGPSIRPRIPAELAGYFSSVTWKETTGPDANRRGLYVFFQRTLPYPALMTFDAPDSNAACTRRERSNTPLQALTLLNDPVFFECAQALGREIARRPGSLESRLSAAFEACLSRPPAPDELSHLRELHDGQVRLLANQPAVAEKLGGGADGREAAAMVLVCRTLMNLDEFITRE